METIRKITIFISTNHDLSIGNMEEIEDELADILVDWGLEGSINNEFTGNITCFPRDEDE